MPDRRAAFFPVASRRYQGLKNKYETPPCTTPPPSTAATVARQRGRYGSRIIVLALNLLCASACSMIQPEPLSEAGDTMDPRDCSLELDRSRQVAPCEPKADGAPTLVIIRLSSLGRSGPTILDRSFVEFSTDQSSPDAADKSRHTWRVDLLHTPSPRPGPHRLFDGDLIYLWNVTSHRYLRVSSPAAAAADAKHRSDASIFVLYKADVTNPNRPSTCDARVRDGDYVYIRALEPSTWFSVSDGVLEPAPLQLPSASGLSELPERPANSAASQRCRTDERNQLLCGWVAQCLR